MTIHRSEGLVLAIHPTSRGFGWALFENPMLPVDWGLATVKAERSVRSLARFVRLLDRYEPEVVVFEEFEERPARRYERIRELCEDMIQLANARGMRTPVYSRETVRSCFAHTGSKTRHGIALSIADQIEIFRHRLPRERKRWGESEDVRQSLFDAVALALTHFAISGKAEDPKAS
ncbi:MAG: hypothetical protein JOZ72_02035 [Alphaproteobacteria bacterium]|nr:hypothetical protein [Alphaproteobacteria bacterium]